MAAMWEKRAAAVWDQLVRLLRRRDDDRSVLGHRLHIRGAITSGGVLEVRGRVDGDIDHTGRLIVGPGGRCVSNIRADELQIAGEVHGNVHVDDLLELLPTGRLYGDTVCGLLRVHPGATLHGSTQMLRAVPPQPVLTAPPQPFLALAGPLAVLSEPVSGRERAELFRRKPAEAALGEPEPSPGEPEPATVERELEEPQHGPSEPSAGNIPSFHGTFYNTAPKSNG